MHTVEFYLYFESLVLGGAVEQGLKHELTWWSNGLPHAKEQEILQLLWFHLVRRQCRKV